jgi:hypothetical protein
MPNPAPNPHSIVVRAIHPPRPRLARAGWPVAAALALALALQSIYAWTLHAMPEHHAAQAEVVRR